MTQEYEYPCYYCNRGEDTDEDMEENDDGYIHKECLKEAKEHDDYCSECGCYISEDSIWSERECMGEYWGAPAYDTFYYYRCKCGYNSKND